MDKAGAKTLLIAAIQANHREMVECLIQAGAKLDRHDFYDRTPLMYRVEMADGVIVPLLIKAGADVNAKNRQGRIALMYAAYNDSVGMIEILLHAGAEEFAPFVPDSFVLEFDPGGGGGADGGEMAEEMAARTVEVEAMAVVDTSRPTASYDSDLSIISRHPTTRGFEVHSGLGTDILDGLLAPRGVAIRAVR